LSGPPLLVLDTNVIISALVSPDPPRNVVEACRAGAAQMVTSDVLLAELAEVLRRKFLWRIDQVAILLDEMRSFAVVVVPAARVDEIRRDPADNRVLECALEARADYIVSGDTRHLLPLGEYRGMPVISPAEMVERLQ